MSAAMTWIATHRKALVAAFGTAVTLGAGVWGTDNKWVTLAIAIATVLGVNQVPNQRPEAPAPAPAPSRRSAPPLHGSGGTEPKD
jgi:hypothetical protein